MIPPLSPDQLKTYLADTNPTVVFLASYILERFSTSQPFTLTADALAALYTAASGAWGGEDDDIMDSSS